MRLILRPCILVMAQAPAAVEAPTPAKAELGSTDAVVGDGDNVNDEAATSPLGEPTAATSDGADQPASVGPGAGQPDKPKDVGTSAVAEPLAKAQGHAAPADAPASVPSAEGSTGLPPPASTATSGGGGAGEGGFQGGFSFGSGLAKSVGGTGFGALAGEVSPSNIRLSCGCPLLNHPAHPDHSRENYTTF